MSAVIRTAFNENDPKYRCCCKVCHVKLGATIIGCIHLIVYALGLVAYAGSVLRMEIMSSSPFGSMMSYIQIGHVIWTSIVLMAPVVLMLYGVHKENHCCILPFVVVTALEVSLTVLLTLSFVTILRPSSPPGTLVLMGVVLVLGVWSGVQIWFFTVVLGCYHFCRDKALKDSMANIEITKPTEFNAGFVPHATVPTEVWSTTQFSGKLQ